MRGIIIVAGGKGLRMGTDIPKQFLPVKGKPILMHTIECFHSFDPSMHIVLVLPKHMQDYWKRLCNEYAFPRTNASPPARRPIVPCGVDNRKWLVMSDVQCEM